MTEHNYTQLKAAFQFEFSESLNEVFPTLWKERSFDRYQLITESGQVERYFYFVLEGVQALYLIDQKGERVILGFSYPGNFSGVFDSYLKQRPSSLFLEALTPSRMLGLPVDAYHQLFDQYAELDRWGRLFFQNLLIGRVSREIELLTLPAKERYIAFMRRCPEELLRIPQKYLASYLNMTPETFSRLRAKVKY
jgi:CRP-like cAMP-binding protein